MGGAMNGPGVPVEWRRARNPDGGRPGWRGQLGGWTRTGGQRQSPDYNPMSKTMRSIPLWFFIASLFVCGCGSAEERYQPARVQAVDGELCFSLGSAAARAEEVPVLSSVRVDERVEGVARNIWQIEFLGQTDFGLSADDCIPYAGGVPDPAPALVPGRAYNVTILADVEGRSAIHCPLVQRALLHAANGAGLAASPG